MMQVLRKMIVLGLAGVGLFKVWEMASPMLGVARGKTANARDRVEPALREVKNTVHSVSKDAAGGLLDASRNAADTLAGAVSDTDAGSSSTGTSGSGASSNTNPTPAPERVNFGG